MNKIQKEVIKTQLNSEQKTLDELKQVYQKALRDCEQKIRELSERTDMENLQSIIYQKQYQEALKAQLEGVLSNLQSNSYATVSDYLAKCYRDGYTGVMYDLQQTGIPIIMPIDQAAVVRAIQTDSKLSKSLYDKMGEDVTYLKKAVRAEVSRGIANGSTWNEVAGKLSRHMANTPFQKAYNNSIRIARTEGHRIQVQSALDAQHVAKSKGADIVKQWDATLDGATREHHQMLDGQIREVDEPFEVANLKVEAPGMFGLASEDCNCRCCLLQRARWALDDEELQTLKDRAAYFDLDKAKEFEEYQEKYLGITQEDIQKYDSTLKVDFKPAMTIEEAEEYAQKFFENGYSPTFKGQAVYKGISLEHANEINKTLEEIYSQYEISKLKGIKAISPTSAQGKKIFSSDDAVAAYNPAEHGIFINKKVLKDAKALEAYNKEAEDAWDIVMKNIDKLTGRQLELAETYKRAGRQIVGDGSVKDYITHEMGHHVQWTMIDPKTGNAIGDRMAKYAPHISGYANASRGEYIAESFAACMKGQKDILDPEFVKLVSDKKFLANSVRDGTIKSGAISGARNPFGEKAQKHAETYYGLVRSMTTDVAKISKATGISEKEIQDIKNYIFLEKHDLGGEKKEYFAPDYMMAESWQRLMSGKPEKHDITLLKHEIMEKKLMQSGMSQEMAHIETSKVYNYSKEAGDFYAKIKKYKKE